MQLGDNSLAVRRCWDLTVGAGKEATLATGATMTQGVSFTLRQLQAAWGHPCKPRCTCPEERGAQAPDPG